ncbi:MAG: ribulose-phosphate 3-epimerase [Fibrobacterales bacterium]
MPLTPVLSPSILSADFSNLAKDIKEAELGGAGFIHLDIMDGHFVPNISFGPVVIKGLRKVTDLPFDCHLMIDEPSRYIPEFIKAGADIVTFQIESTNHADRTINLIKELGAKAGVSINPGTPISAIEPVLDIVDMVLIMSVNPGFGGQKLIPYTLEKVKAIRALKPDLDIEVDGGIKLENIKEVQEAGANIFVAGSAVFGQDDVVQACKDFCEKMN